MCLIGFSFDARARKFVLAANRDEYYHRPTAQAHWWPDGVTFAGRDLQAGGTWLAVNRRGRLAALTNYRDAFAPPANVRSRGELVTSAIDPSVPVMDQVASLEKRLDQYAGFNLLILDWTAAQSTGLQAWYVSNRSAQPAQKLNTGTFGLSNGLLDEAWPKTERLRNAVADVAGHPVQRANNRLLSVLTDRQCAPDATLPDTGVGLDRERLLAPAFIRSDASFGYGTRSSAIVRLDESGLLSFDEWTWQTEQHLPGSPAHAVRAMQLRQ